MDVRQTEIHTTEPLVPKPSASGVELAIENLKSHKSPGVDQNPAELIRAMRSINLLSDATGQLLIIYSTFVKFLRKNGNTMKQCISSL